MKRPVLVDTGPLVAIFSRADEHHAACVEVMHHVPGPLFTCWPVITEAAWLLRSHPAAMQQLMKILSLGSFVAVLPLAATEATPIAAIMHRYADLRPQLADAALVHLAHREEIDTIFTLDRRDFSVYRSSRKRAFHLVP